MKSRSSRIIFLIFIFCFFSGITSAQYQTSSPIYAGALSPNKSKIALVDSERISILNTNNFEEIWSIPCNNRVDGVVSEIFFSQNNDSLLFFRASKFNGDLEADINFIYYSDSLVVANFVSHTLQSYPGNIQASFGKNAGNYCVFANYGHEFIWNGQQNWWADGTVLYTKELENIQLKTPIIKCALSGDGEKIAILTRSQNISKPNELQVLDAHTQTLIYSSILPEQNYTNMQFSVEGNSIYLESCQVVASSIYSKYISDLENVRDTLITINPGTKNLSENIIGKKEYGLRLVTFGGEFKIIDQTTLKEKHVFWPNACNLFNIHNAFLLSEDEVIVYGSYSDYQGPNLTGAANKMKLTDVAVFTQIDEKKGSYKAFDPNAIQILPNNSSVKSKSERKIVIGENRKLVNIIEDRYLEIWKIEDRSILRRFSFENDIDVLADRYDSTLLVLEKHEDYNERNIRLHIINLNTGYASFQIVSRADAEAFALKNSYSKISDEEGAELLLAVQKNWPWESSEDTPLFTTSISTDNQELLLIEKNLINLKTLENSSVEDYSDRILLDKDYSGLSVELCTKFYWDVNDKRSQGKNTFFAIKDFRNERDTLAQSDPFKLRVDGSYYQSEISRSSTSRFVCAYINEFFKETERDIYLFDIQKNKVHEFLNAGLSWIEFNESDSLFQIVKLERNNQDETEFTYSLYDAISFKKIGESNSSFLSTKSKEEKTSELNSPESALEALYISSETTKKHFGFFSSGKMYVWNFGERSPIETVSLGFGKPVHCSFVGQNIFVVLDSREAFFINPTTNSVVCSALFIPDEEKTDVLWYLPDGSFYTPKNTIAKFHMVKGKDVFPLLNYEVLLNRPDKILEAIGLAEPETIEAFGMAYEKRNKKFPAQSIDFKSGVPQLIWKSSFPSEIKDSTLLFSVALSGPINQNYTAHVLINGVPFFGSKGMSHSSTDTQFEINATLESGKNEILVYIQTENGLNSFPISKEIRCDYEFHRRLYFVGFGVSAYVDSSKNLKFADSDIIKLYEEFSNAYGQRYSGSVFTNELATRKNIMDSKNLIERSGVNDIVVVALAGHGTLDKNNNFYFCPHDVNFTDPENTGVSYFEIEGLLDGIPARKKLLLIDACHSGEIQDSFTPVFVSDLKVEKDSRGIDVIVSGETNSQKEINFLVESLFSNLNNGTGAFVISASGGSEYAFETEKTGGVFTYSFLESFKDHFYKYQPDPFVTTLQQETYQKVTALTKGAQRPTARSENFRNSWKFE